MNRTSLIIAAVAITAICLSFATSALLSPPGSGPFVAQPTSTPLQSIGVNAYTDPQATVLCSEIDWGTIDEGENATQTIYVKNALDSNVTLHIYASEWMPVEAEGLMDLFWDLEGVSVLPGEVVAATLTLTTSWDMGAVDSFGFTLTVQGLV